VLCSWDPHHNPILAEVTGIIRYEDILEGKTFRTERDSRDQGARKVMIEHKGDLHPQIMIEDENGNRSRSTRCPRRLHRGRERQKVVAGMLLAKTPREIQGTQDITGGLPR
jgi:DNA-directed RNA polymerase subunit beta'